MTHAAFVKRLLAVMEVRGLKQYSLEDRAKVSTGLVNKIVNGVRVNTSADVAVKLADALEVDVGWLLTGRMPRKDWKPPV